jgi:hypothetical protein
LFTCLQHSYEVIEEVYKRRVFLENCGRSGE